MGYESDDKKKVNSGVEMSKRNVIAEFFQDSSGLFSITRLCFFLLNLTAIFVIVWTTLVNNTPRDSVEIVTVILGASFAGKVTQKKVEEDSYIKSENYDQP